MEPPRVRSETSEVFKSCVVAEAPNDDEAGGQVADRGARMPRLPAARKAVDNTHHVSDTN
jgi:hypothetical protein